MTDHEALEKAYEAAAKVYAERRDLSDEDLSWIVEQEIKPAISAFLSSLDGKPIAYLHTMHQELDQKHIYVSTSPQHPWGKRGEDYDPSYEVTTEPLFRALAAPDITKKGTE